MNIPTNHQIIEHNGAPVAVVIPYDEYVKAFMGNDDDVAIPDAIARRILLENVSLIRAWREHFGLTQAEVAKRMDISQPSYQQLEDKTTKPRPATLQRLADALQIDPEQLYL